MNIEICKKCFASRQNIIHYILITHHPLDGNKLALRINGLIAHDANENANKHACNQTINFSNELLKYTNDYNSCEKDWEIMLNKIKEPGKKCDYYCEHVMEEYEKEKL